MPKIRLTSLTCSANSTTYLSLSVSISIIVPLTLIVLVISFGSGTHNLTRVPISFSKLTNCAVSVKSFSRTDKSR